MTNDKYILRYLPLFYKDLEEKIVYIAAVSYTHLDVYKRQGVERVTKVMMIALLLIMIVLAAHSFFLEGAEKGIERCV